MPRVVLYAEGPGESGTSLLIERSPTRSVPSEHEGPAHVLIRRCLDEHVGHPSASIRFDWPLRVQAREARGSDLLVRRTLRSLLTWADPTKQPDLAVVLVDQDGDAGRRASLLAMLEPPLLTVPVVAVAVEEFEAWLIADHAALNRVLELGEQQGKNPESLAPGEAKSILAALVAKSPRAGSNANLRVELARASSLKVVVAKCRAFERFVGELRTALPLT